MSLFPFRSGVQRHLDPLALARLEIIAWRIQPEMRLVVDLGLNYITIMLRGAPAPEVIQ